MLLFLLLACGNDCDYFESCDGSTLLVCGESADQSFNRKVNEVPCEAPNDVCVAVGDQNATCAAAEDSCEAGAAPSCDGDVLLLCEPFISAIGLLGEGSDASFVQGYDCAAEGQVCGADDSGVAACVDAV